MNPRTRCQRLAPATKKTENATAQMMTAVPMSGSTTTRPAMMLRMIRNGIEPWVNRETPLALPGQPVRHVDDDGDLGELAGLERRQRPELQPARRAVLDHPEARHQHQHQRDDRDDQQHQRDLLPAVVVDAGGDDQADRADGDPGELAGEEVGLVAELVVGDDDAGAVDHLGAEARAAARPLRSGCSRRGCHPSRCPSRRCGARTTTAKWSPRSPESTQEPGPAPRAATSVVIARERHAPTPNAVWCAGDSSLARRAQRRRKPGPIEPRTSAVDRSVAEREPMLPETNELTERTQRSRVRSGREWADPTVCDAVVSRSKHCLSSRWCARSARARRRASRPARSPARIAG